MLQPAACTRLLLVPPATPPSPLSARPTRPACYIFHRPHRHLAPRSALPYLRSYSPCDVDRPPQTQRSYLSLPSGGHCHPHALRSPGAHIYLSLLPTTTSEHGPRPPECTITHASWSPPSRTAPNPPDSQASNFRLPTPDLIYH
ncbi:hypothetical protein BC628DRAFT_150007 [Trametes gibbosa]|nr:hypothetical protein BC628DRAFT_150007 [Trametes gibbosa]